MGVPASLQVCPYGLYAEQVSGTAFTAPRRCAGPGPGNSASSNKAVRGDLQSTQRSQRTAAGLGPA